jgi:acylphosphatase
MAEQLHVFVSGLVQGVGFRHATYRQAQKLGLRGWVRNRSDGRVEAVLQGERPALDQMLDWCARGPALARVDRVAASWEPADTALPPFEIAF